MGIPMFRILLATFLAFASSPVFARSYAEESGAQHGLIVHAGCGDGAMVERLAAGAGRVVQGLDTSPGNVSSLQARLLGAGLYGTASAAIFEEVGLGADVLSESGERVTWGDVYLIFLDDSPDTVLLEETSTGEWMAVSVDE